MVKAGIWKNDGKGKENPFPSLSFLAWKDGKGMFPHLENCCAAGMGQVAGILFLGLKKP